MDVGAGRAGAQFMTPLCMSCWLIRRFASLLPAGHALPRLLPGLTVHKKHSCEPERMLKPHASSKSPTNCKTNAALTSSSAAACKHQKIAQCKNSRKRSNKDAFCKSLSGGGQQSEQRKSAEASGRRCIGCENRHPPPNPPPTPKTPFFCLKWVPPP